MADTTPVTKDELLTGMQQGWRDFDAYLQTLTEAQLTIPTDATGWTAKDHVMHLAVWEAGILVVLEGGSRREGMGIDEALWQRWNVDDINAAICQRYQRLPLAEALKRFRDVHQRLFAKVQTFSENDLQRPFRAYQPDTNYEGSLSDRIVANTSAHYAGHKPWIAAIVAEADNPE